jgi:hypothetical protein
VNFLDFLLFYLCDLQEQISEYRKPQKPCEHLIVGPRRLSSRSGGSGCGFWQPDP